MARAYERQTSQKTPLRQATGSLLPTHLNEEADELKLDLTVRGDGDAE